MPTWRVGINLMVTMLLGGLWHGAAWNFVLWGGVHGLALVIFHLWGYLPGRPGIPVVVIWTVTQVFVFLSWILFRAPDLETARLTFVSLLKFDFRLDEATGEMVHAFYAGPFTSLAPTNAGIVGVVAFLMVGFMVSTIRPTHRQLIWLRRRSAIPIALLTCLASLVALALWNRTLQAGRADPFIYFQF